MDNIYLETIQKVSAGARFTVDFESRSLKLNGKQVIKDGVYEGKLGCEPSEDPLPEIERLYQIYQHSLPSERSDRKRRRYFSALPFEKLSDEDMLYGEHREVAQVSLELYVLCQILHGTLDWAKFAEGKWFWQSPVNPSLVLLKKWVQPE